MIETPQLNAADVNLNDYLDIVRRRRWIIIQTFVVVTAIGLITTMMTTPIYRATAKLKVDATPITISTQNTDNPLTSILSQAQPDSVETQMQMLQVEPFIERVLKTAGVTLRPGRPAPEIKVSNIDRTNVIVVQVDSPSPREAAAIAETMLELHRSESWENSTASLKSALEFVSGEVGKSQRSLNTAEEALQKYERDNGVTEMSAQEDSEVKKYIDIETELRSTASNIFRLKTEIQEIQAQLKKEPDQSETPVVNENPRYEQILTQLDELKQQRVALLQLYQESNFKVRNLDAQIQSVETRLQHEPKERKIIQRAPNPARLELHGRLSGALAELRGLEAARSKLEAQVAEGRTLMGNLGPTQVQLTKLKRQQEMAQNEYKNLEKEREDLELRFKAQRHTDQIIEQPVTPKTPVRPRKALNLLFASLMGICLGVSMAFLQEFLDDRVNSPEDAERTVALPVLGYIPMMTDGQDRLMTEMPTQSLISESYRGLRSSISFAAVDEPIKTLLVSSSNKGEGKSLTSVNLAIAMALDRRRVILVDADLRRPNIHRLMRVEQSPGLSDLLVDRVPLEDALQDTDVEGLQVIASGPRPPDPAELLNSHRMRELISQLGKMADMVIFDTPPCIPVTDAQVLATKVNGVILVLEVGEAKKAALRHAKGLFDQAHARTLGLVFNKIGQGASQGYYYYYTSGASYYTDEFTAEHTNGKRERRRIRALAPARTPSSAAPEEQEPRERRRRSRDDEEF
jgi:capsular exopolysaccharide synthesis family protein